MDDIFLFVDGFSPLILVKVLLVIGVLVYLMFALLISRQINLMGNAIRMRDDFVIKIIGFSHLVYTILVLIIVLLV